MAGIVFSYGTFSHRACEVYPKTYSAEALRGPNGVVWGVRRVLDIAGDLVGNDGAEMSSSEVVTRIGLIDSAYSTDFKDAKFTLPDGTTTVHTMLNGDTLNLSGNRVVYKSWDHVDPGELANTRSFSVRIEALYRANPGSIISYHESTTKIGNGGPIWKLYETANGTIKKVVVSDISKVVHITVGEVIAGARLSPPASLWPTEEQGWRREITQGTPVDHGHPTGKFTHYRTSWKYYHERLGASPLLPPDRFA